MTLRCTCAAVLLALLFTAAPSPSRYAAAQPLRRVIVVVSKATGGSDIELKTLRHVYEGFNTDFNGKRLIPFNLPVGTPARIVLDKEVIGLSPNQVGRFWIDKKVRGIGDPPRTLPSSDLVFRVVASLQGSIGYVDADPATVPSMLRVLSIDGLQPDDPDYPLVQR